MELKNGDTYNGNLVNCDSWMNINLAEVICTSRDGDRFWKLSTCYIRGNTIKYLRIPDEVIDSCQEEEALSARERNSMRGRGRGGRGGHVGGIGRGQGKGRGGRGQSKGGGRGQQGGRGGRGGRGQQGGRGGGRGGSS